MVEADTEGSAQDRDFDTDQCGVNDPERAVKLG